MLKVVADLYQNRFYPNKKTLEAYEDPKRGNRLKREKDNEEAQYEQFIERCKKFDMFLRAVHVIRTRAVIDGEWQEVLYYYGHLVGQDASELPREFPLWVGFYDEPLFAKKLNKETDEYEVTGVRDKLRRYLTKYSPAEFDALHSVIDARTQFYVKENPEAVESYRVFNKEDFRDGTINELLRMGREKKTIDEVRAAKQGGTVYVEKGRPTTSPKPDSIVDYPSIEVKDSSPILEGVITEEPEPEPEPEVESDDEINKEVIAPGRIKSKKKKDIRL